MLYNALIRTHHITSRKKVAILKRAAETHQCFVLLRSGGCPGIMYIEGLDQMQVQSWVGIVRKLRYKDFQLVIRPGPLALDPNAGRNALQPSLETLPNSMKHGLFEVDSVKDFSNIMAHRRVWNWWRKGMGYI